MQIRDAVLGDIKIKDQLILDVINTREFQRLRKIKQLGLTYMVFPSAEHTRFSHSIGVYSLANKVITKLISKGFEVSELERNSFLLAALLHDVGHGPLSHTAEFLFGYSHEDYSCKIIRENGTQLNQVLKKYNPNYIKETCKIISKKHENKVLVKLLSSSVDIDRMDYLPRDSQVTGVVYGDIEIDRLTDKMIVIDDELCFDLRAVNMIEDFLISRYQMFSQVYLNKKSLTYEELVRTILMRVSKLYEEGYNFNTDITLLIPFLQKDFTVKQYLRMNDVVMRFLLEQLGYEDDQELSALIKSYEDTNPITFKLDDKYEYHEFSIEAVCKNKIYNETILLVDENQKLHQLEDVSQLMKFAKYDLQINVEGFKAYVRK